MPGIVRLVAPAIVLLALSPAWAGPASPASAPASAPVYGRVVGTVVDAATGKPVPRIAVYAWGPVTRNGATGADGHYAIERVPAGTYTVMAYRAGARVQHPGVVVTPGKTATADLRLSLSATEEFSGESVSAGSMAESPRAAVRNQLLDPAGSIAVGGTLGFLTAAGGGLGLARIDFADAVLLGLQASYVPADWDELVASVTLLPKQPADVHERLWQGAALGDRVALGEHFAGALDAALGPALGEPSLWESAAAALEARADADRSMVFKGWAGAEATTFRLTGDTDRDWLDDVFVDGEVTLRDPDGECCAAWLGTRFYFPVVATPSRSHPDPATGAFLAPRTWVTFRAGAVLSYVENWDLYGELDVTSRGAPDAVGSTVPILVGGFSQTLVVVGVTRHFREHDERGGLLRLLGL